MAPCFVLVCELALLNSGIDVPQCSMGSRHASAQHGEYAIHSTNVQSTMICTCLTSSATHVMMVIFASVKMRMQNIITCF